MSKINIVIFGSGKELEDTVACLQSKSWITILGIVDPGSNPITGSLAKKCQISLYADPDQIENKADIVVSLNGKNSEIVREIKPEFSVFTNVLADCLSTQRTLKKTGQELELQTWGMNKTNEAIKLLYKELESKNRELQKLDQMKSDFVSIVSHELRTPLTTIRETVAQVLEGILGPTTPEQKEFLKMCLDDIDRLSRIINNLLDISKIEAGQADLKRERIDLKDVVEHVVQALIFKAKDKGLELLTELPQKNVFVYADRDKLIQVFTNLVNNALKFTQKGSITIKAKILESVIECAVCDTGIGISEEDLQKIFGKFQQFGRTHGAGEKGTGLGLSISKGIVELHKGKIWVESGQGKGTQFIFTLPVHTPESYLKEILQQAAEEARQKETKITLGVLFLGADGAGKDGRMLAELEQVIGRALRQMKDIVLSFEGDLLVALLYCDKGQAIKMGDRLNQSWAKFCSEKQYKLRQLEFRWLTYPGDVADEEEFFEHIYRIKKEQAQT